MAALRYTVVRRFALAQCRVLVWGRVLAPRLVVALAVTLLAVGANAASATAAPVVLRDVPFVAQDAGFCGPAALAMAMAYADPSQDDPLDLAQELAGQVVTPGLGGALQADLVGAARRHGYTPAVVTDEGALRDALAAGRPVVVLQNLRFRWWPQWHYAVVVGFDDARGDWLLHTGDRPYARVAAAKFHRQWARWGLVLAQ